MSGVLPAKLARMPKPLRWDIFCRVIDHHGDLGVCWRLAHDLAEQGDSVHLWVDSFGALAWMAPQGHLRVAVLQWEGAAHSEPMDVVVEAFGCNPPAPFVGRMAARTTPPVWINLEYLSAESYVERSHGLASPQNAGPGRGLSKWFYYPGFTPATGGLIRESRLPLVPNRARRAALGVQAHERAVSLFAYAHAPLEQLLDRLDHRPTAVLLCAGASQTPALACFDATGRRGQHLRCIVLPYLKQTQYDELLADCDLNLVRGEDSLVRAMWAGRPFIWNAYRQGDGAHGAKVEALLAQMQTPLNVAAIWRAWNGLADWPELQTPWPEHPAWSAHCEKWREILFRQPSLTLQLRDFALGKQAKR
jgi:uncharacterized repeat protein (TIGR03837 family)